MLYYAFFFLFVVTFPSIAMEKLLPGGRIREGSFARTDSREPNILFCLSDYYGPFPVVEYLVLFV